MTVVDNIDASMLPEQGRGNCDAGPDIGRMSVLCVDDLASNVKVLGFVLKALGVKDVRTALSGAEALKLVEERAPEVIITDIWMPEMSGIELARAIAAKQRLPPIRLIALTADMMAVTNPEDIKVFERVLEKPVSMKAIREVLCRHAPSSAPIPRLAQKDSEVGKNDSGVVSHCLP